MYHYLNEDENNHPTRSHNVLYLYLWFLSIGAIRIINNTATYITVLYLAEINPTSVLLVHKGILIKHSATST